MSQFKGRVNHEEGDVVRLADYGPDRPFTGAVIVSTDTRAQAIADGLLIDVTATA